MFYLDLFAALNRRVDYVLIDGLAILLHGIERATMDIDVTVAMTPDNLSARVEMARELDMTPVVPVALESLSDLDQLAQGHRERNRRPSHSVRPACLASRWTYCPTRRLITPKCAATFLAGDVPVAVAPIDDMIAPKQAVGRPIDLADIEHLKRLKEI
ncbi:MAG: hypothetical protein K0M39_14895 [Rhizobium sp.]|nr:hypothetical protein [Rhizobium sp.]